jgi:putative endonuclease
MTRRKIGSSDTCPGRLYYNPRVHFVYIVRCADGTLYTGYARNPGAREKMHNSGRGARYTAGRRPVRLVYSESFKSVGDALRRERQLKRLRRTRKEALLARTSAVPVAGT